jgi:hypothetical protein
VQVVHRLLPELHFCDEGKEAGCWHKNIVTDGFGVWGQVDLINFQSMPDGEFKFLFLNYIDHDIKKLMSIPSSCKARVGRRLGSVDNLHQAGTPNYLASLTMVVNSPGKRFGPQRLSEVTRR